MLVLEIVLPGGPEVMMDSTDLDIENLNDESFSCPYISEIHLF